MCAPCFFCRSCSLPQEPKVSSSRPSRLLLRWIVLSEHHQPLVGFPNGGIRSGTDVIRASAGGNAMVSEVHSHSSHGDLDYLSVTWWERSSGVYRLLMCAKQFPEGCVTGASAR